MKKFVSLLAALVLPAALGAQSISGVGAVLHPLNRHISDAESNLITFADGPRLVPSNGGIWFLEANADRIAFFKNDVVTEWPIRSHDYSDPYRSIGANPADFELDPDGKTIWFVENGNSGIDLNESVFASLDTTTNTLTEWIVPISKPAGFLRLPGGIVWLPMSQGSLVKLDLNTLEVVAYRGPDSLGYSGIVLGTDGDFYLSDYGSNRLVKIDPQTLTETAWQAFDPLKGRVSMSQPTLDGAGNFWVAEDFDGGSLARLNLSTGAYDRFAAGHLLSPTHFFFQGNLVYAVETDSFGGDGRIVVVDTNTVNVDKITTTPKSAALVTLPLASARARTTTLVPITFQSGDSSPDGIVVASAPEAGISRFTLPHGSTFISTTSYSIATIDGKILAGVRGALAEFTLLPPAPPTDLVVPIAVNAANGVLRTDFLFFNARAQSGRFTATFYSSPVPPSPAKGYTLGAGVTLHVGDALGPAELRVGDATGSLRFTPFTGDEGAYQAVTRSYALVENNGTYGFSLPAQLVSAGVTAGSALFLHSQADETSSFGIYSPTGGSGTATLHGADGGARGSYSFFLPANNRQAFDPAFSAFGAASEPGSYITFLVTSGSLFPFAAIRQQTGDIAVGIPVAPATTAIFPAVGARTNPGGSSNVTDILLANSDLSNAATVTLTFYPLDPATPSSSTSVTLSPGSSRTVPYRDPVPGFGALVVTSTLPVCAQARYANHTPAGDYAGLASPVAPAAHARFLLSPDPHLRNNLMIFNSGAEGRANVVLYNASGVQDAVFGIPVVPHQLIILNDMSAYFDLSGGGSIDVYSDQGALLESWLASSDRVTGDPDAQASPPAVP